MQYSELQKKLALQLVEAELERADILLRDRISDLLGREEWNED